MIQQPSVIETITVEEAVERGYLKPGRIVLTNRPADFMAAGIRLFEALHLGRPANWQHAMRVSHNPSFAISQNWEVEMNPFTNWAGCNLRVWEPPEGYTSEQVKAILVESYLALGRKYDWLGILGQVSRITPWAGDWLSSKIQFSGRTFCSEFVAITERKVNQAFMAEVDRYQVSPADIDAWCMAHGWKSETFTLAGEPEAEADPVPDEGEH